MPPLLGVGRTMWGMSSSGTMDMRRLFWSVKHPVEIARPEGGDAG